MGSNSIRTVKSECSTDVTAGDPARVIDENTGGLTAHLESSGLRIINSPMGQELIMELNSFEDGSHVGRGHVR
jgi:hypothetical protein